MHPTQEFHSRSVSDYHAWFKLPVLVPFSFSVLAFFHLFTFFWCHGQLCFKFIVFTANLPSFLLTVFHLLILLWCCQGFAPITSHPSSLFLSLSTLSSNTAMPWCSFCSRPFFASWWETHCFLKAIAFSLRYKEKERNHC